MKHSYIIATIKSWNIKAAKLFILKNPDKNIYLITKKEELLTEKVKAIKPRYLFFPHWSWKIPKEIYENNECVIFHMTDLPFGRGGSPLQNLIIRGFKKTKISAIKATAELDAGPVYMKKQLSLQGSAEQIFKRASTIIFNHMIPFIIKQQPHPVPQQGKIVQLQRRTSEESNIEHLDDISTVYDYIRMLDAEGYPLAYIETKFLRIEFSDTTKRKGAVVAKATFKKKDMES
ncbi:MAG: methionyl-tRNA formyltransferase [Candidatus Thermoplasmatota archaeon]|nr:methionyl-tRNA formyltransferase [Candidatus Thermoplasmatota archaeon]